MKKHRYSLQDRIAWSFVLLAFAVCSFFTLTAYISIEVAEAQLLDDRLLKVAETLVQQYRTNQKPNVPSEVNFYVDDAIPRELQKLALGKHELQMGEREIHALMMANGAHRFAVVYETTDFERTELVLFIALAVGFITSLLLAIMLGLATARRVIAPVSALADAVSGNTESDALPSLDSDDEIGVLARAFAKRTDELQRYLGRERLFTGDVSHELRTPLTVMLGAAELLKVQLSDRPDLLAVAERLRRVAAETSERVSALLLLSRSPEAIDAPLTALNPLIESERARCQPVLLGKSVECQIEASEPVWIHARPELVGIVIGNLLRNACLYADLGVVKVQLTPGRLVIEDHGPGLPANVRAHLFERFVQGNDGAAGSGLGLSIVKRVVEHLGWEIRLEEPPNGGSRFILTFPHVAASVPSA